MYWTRYYNQLAFNSKWSWHNELDNRRFFEHNIQHHFISHSHLHYLILPNLDLSLGVTYSRQSPQFTNLPNRLVVPEIRPFQEITLTTPFSKRLTFSQRLRIDERFIHSNNGIELLNGYEFNWRFRYRMQATVLISKIGVKYPTHLKLANELMINAGKNIVFNYFDQNRFYVGIEHAFSKKIAIEAGYLHWFQQRNTGNQFFNRDIFRLTLYHRIKL
ncbi:MAG: DUF2490 domain-containing protein [Spirosomataceae bacterium]